MQRKNSNAQPKIKMVAFNPISRKYEDVYPESEVETSSMIPMFWCSGERRYMTVPGCTAADVYGEWAEAIR